MRFFCVTRPGLEAVDASLKRACRARDIEFVQVVPAMLWQPLAGGPVPGDLLYRAATDAAAVATEGVLAVPGVATFDRTPGLTCTSPLPRYLHHDLPVPRTVFNLVSDRDELDRAVEAVGGLPVILKVPGGEGGSGVMKVDSWETLLSLVDYLPVTTWLQEYVEHTEALRLIVVGEEVVAAESRAAADRDFRTNAAGSRALGPREAFDLAREIALTAARLNEVEFGGADLLVTERGGPVLTEFNSPCYFPDTERSCGVDIAGAMVEHLRNKTS